MGKAWKPQQNYTGGNTGLYSLPSKEKTNSKSAQTDNIRDTLSKIKQPSFAIGFTIPAGTLFQKAYQYGAGDEVATTRDTICQITASSAGLQISFNPYVDVHIHGLTGWAFRDVLLKGTHLDFKTGKTEVMSEYDPHSPGWFWVSQGKVEDSVKQMMANLTKDTPFAKGNYDPMKDEKLMDSFNKVVDNFKHLPTGPGAEPVPEIEPAKFTNPYVVASWLIDQDQSFPDKGVAQMRVMKDKRVSVRVDLQGGLGKNIEEAKKIKDEKKADIKVNDIIIDTEGLVLYYKDAPVLNIKKCKLNYGGKYELIETELEGAALNAANTESDLRLLLAAVGVLAKVVSPHSNPRDIEDPKIVKGLTRRQVEEDVTKAIHDLVKSKFDIIPQLNLCDALGIK